MKVILLGTTGMVGQGVLRECLLDPGVERVLSLGRSATGATHEKLREVVHKDLHDLAPIEGELAGYDACFFCLGVSSAGMSEAEYRRVTYDLTISVARTLHRLNPGMTFIYVSGSGTDSTERGRTMWARVKGATENALLAMGFKAAYMFRPGIIQPLGGIRPRSRVYRFAYSVIGPLIPLARAASPKLVTTTENVGLAMIAVARHGDQRTIFENRDINQLADAVHAKASVASS